MVEQKKENQREFVIKMIIVDLDNEDLEKKDFGDKEQDLLNLIDLQVKYHQLNIHYHN